MAALNAGTRRSAHSYCGRMVALAGRRRAIETGVLALLLVFSVSVGCWAQDGTALMQKMISAYQHLTSYEGHSNVDVTWTSRGKVLRAQSITTHMQIQRPNKIALTILNSGQTGTRSIDSDGSKLTLYDALPNHYTIGPTAPDMAKMVDLLARKVHVSAQADPLYFFCLDKMPPGLTGIKTGGSKLINGRDSLIVKGSIPITQGSVSAGDKKTPAASFMHWTWYIDKQTFLLNKIEAYSDIVMMPANKGQGNRTVKTTMPVVVQLRHNVGMFLANPPLDAGVFTFKAPAGAIEQKSASQILQGKR